MNATIKPHQTKSNRIVNCCNAVKSILWQITEVSLLKAGCDYII